MIIFWELMLLENNRYKMTDSVKRTQVVLITPEMAPILQEITWDSSTKLQMLLGAMEALAMQWVLREPPTLMK
jgi:hypothetical protein